MFHNHAPRVVSDLLSLESLASALAALFEVVPDAGGDETATPLSVGHLIEKFEHRTGFANLFEPPQQTPQLCAQLFDGRTRQLKNWKDFAQATGCGPGAGGTPCINAFTWK